LDTLSHMIFSQFTSIANNLIPGSEVKDVVRLTGGVSADVHRLDVAHTDGKTTSLVIRAHRNNHTGLCATLEYRLLTSLHRIGIPVPMPLYVDVTHSLVAYPYLVLEFVEGTSDVSGEKEVANIDIMANMLRQIHSVSTSDLPQLTARIDPLPEVFDYLPEGRDWDSLRNHLYSLSETVYTEVPVLLHGDFWPENLLWENGSIAAVLDWEDAAYGDPLSDVACCRLELRYKFGKLRMQQFTRTYAGRQFLDLERLALWQVYVSAAAQHYMGEWGLATTVEAHMRKEALSSIREAGIVLMGGKIP